MTEQIGLDRLTAIIAFARAASLGSYSAAARSLAISPSAVSKSIQRLEEKLGVRLFSRTTRSLNLTPEGQRLYGQALKLLREAEAIEQMAFAARREPSGLLRVTAPVPVGLHILAARLAEFRDRYPSVTVDLRLSDTLTDLVEEGVDVAIRVGQVADSRLIAKELGPNRVCTFASPAYLARRGVPLRVEDLRTHDCVNVRFKSSGQPLRWPFNVLGELHVIEPEAVITVDDSSAVAAIVASGAGIGLSPTFVAAPYVARGELIPVLSEYHAEPSQITALWPESRRGNPTVQAFVGFLEEVFTPPTPWNKAIFPG